MWGTPLGATRGTNLGKRLGLFFAVCSLLATAGCNEVKGRRAIQQGNALYRDAKYAEAISKFEQAEALIPNFPTLWLNKGFTCKRMIMPGTKTPENTRAADCAIKSFSRFKELVPDDSRGDMLYTQTLFDADRFETLAGIYEGRFKQDAQDEQAVSVLMQVYSKWDTETRDKGGKLDAALEWYRVHVSQRPKDPEAYYAVGTFIFGQLQLKGGGIDKQCWDPRPGAKIPEKCLPPGAAYGDIVAQQRIDLADEGIKYLEKAVELRPTYTDAMTYVNLLWRQRSYAFFAQPEEWFACLQKAEEWKNKTLEILRQRGVSGVAAIMQAAGAHSGVKITALEVEKAVDEAEGAEAEGEEGATAGAAAKVGGDKAAPKKKPKARKKGRKR